MLMWWFSDDNAIECSGIVTVSQCLTYLWHECYVYHLPELLYRTCCLQAWAASFAEEMWWNWMLCNHQWTSLLILWWKEGHRWSSWRWLGLRHCSDWCPGAVMSKTMKACEIVVLLCWAEFIQGDVGSWRILFCSCLVRELISILKYCQNLWGTFAWGLCSCNNWNCWSEFLFVKGVLTRSSPASK